MNEDVITLEKQINNPSKQKTSGVNEASTKDEIRFGVNFPFADGSITEHLKRNRNEKGCYTNLYKYTVSEDNLKLA